MLEKTWTTRVPILIWTTALAVLILLHSQTQSSIRQKPNGPKRLDPSAWGGDHVGKAIPKYLTGDECLFCHRKRAAATWGENRHNLTIRRVGEKEPAIAALLQSSLKSYAKETSFVLGNKKRRRFLKPAKAYGKLDLLSVEWIPPHDSNAGKLISTDRAHWDGKKFGGSCAGCHATAVDAKKQTFLAVSLDCYVCHGNVHPDHTKKPELAYFAKKAKQPARVVISICAQCHVRHGKSESSGLPYPNNFVPGDNLFRDFKVDFSDEKIKSLSIADQHILENVRDVVVFGKEKITCLSCHDVHSGSSVKHRRVTKSNVCLNCHHAKGPKRNLKPFTWHSKTCGY